VTSHTSSPVITAIIVLYNPDHSVMENIESYIDKVDKIYAVDNSEYKNNFFIKEFQKNKKIKYIDNKGNRGIAHALNVGASEAIKDGYDFLLTMDQDSKASEKMIFLMLECLKNFNMAEIGIISPFHASKFHAVSSENGCVEKKMVMTSGNLLSLEAYKKTGPFLEELFLDYVDNEYCLRLQKNGYVVVQASEAILHHNLGELSMHTLLGKNIYCYNYPPIRYYYRTRNVIVTNRAYDYIDYLYFKELLKDIIKIMLYEKNKMKKFQHMCFGIVDAIKGKMGKYDR